MRHLSSQHDQFISRSLRPSRSFLIIHDDVESGARAKEFVDRLAEETGHFGGPQVSMWDHESLECSDLAISAWLAAERADVVMLSLGERKAVSHAVLVWIRAWLEYAGGERTRFVVIASAEDRNAAMQRGCFQELAARHGVDFLWHQPAAAIIPARRRRRASEVPAIKLGAGRGLFTAAAMFCA